jgi:hypothetical protein
MTSLSDPPHISVLGFFNQEEEKRDEDLLEGKSNRSSR